MLIDTPTNQTSKVEYIELDLLELGSGTQCREGLNKSTVIEYAEAMENNVDFPPIDVYFDGEKYYVADGFHRAEARKRAKIQSRTIAANIYPGTLRDAILHSIGANILHGLRRTNSDKRRAVERMLQDDEWLNWSDNAIAKQCGVSQPFVSKLREASAHNSDKPNKRKGLDGRNTNTEKIGKQKNSFRHKKVEKVYKHAKGLNIQELETLHSQLGTLLLKMSKPSSTRSAESDINNQETENIEKVSLNNNEQESPPFTSNSLNNFLDDDTDDEPITDPQLLAAEIRDCFSLQDILAVKNRCADFNQLMPVVWQSFLVDEDKKEKAVLFEQARIISAEECQAAQQLSFDLEDNLECDSDDNLECDSEDDLDE